MRRLGRTRGRRTATSQSLASVPVQAAPPGTRRTRSDAALRLGASRVAADSRQVSEFPTHALVSISQIDLSASTLRYPYDLLTARRRERGTRWRPLTVDRQAPLGEAASPPWPQAGT